MTNIKSRLDRLEEARGDGRPALIIYEADGELSPEDEAAFLKVAVPDMHPNAFIYPKRRLAGVEPAPPRVLRRYKPTWTHEEALEHLR